MEEKLKKAKESKLKDLEQLKGQLKTVFIKKPDQGEEARKAAEAAGAHLPTLGHLLLTC